MNLVGDHELLEREVPVLETAGEVLVTRTVKDLTVGSELGFEERGAQALRGVPGSWEVFAASTPENVA